MPSENAVSASARRSTPGLSDEITFVMGAWGAWHVDAFLSFCLPSLMSPGNLPSLLKMRPASFVIFTSEQDRQTMEASALWRQFTELLDVGFVILDFDRIRERNENPVETQRKVWLEAIELVIQRKSYLFFVPPDVVWSDGSMLAVGRAMEAGRSIVIIPWVVRVVAETFGPAMRAYFDRHGSQAGISGRELVKLTIAHLHPLMSAYNLDSTFFPHHPEMLLVPVARQGLALRLLASIPTIYRPSEIVLNQQNLVARPCRDEELYMPSDSDELFVASMTPFSKDAHFFDRPRRADPVSVGHWWHIYQSGANDYLTRRSYRIHYQDLDKTRWRRAEQRTDLFVRRSVIAREGLLVWSAIREDAELQISSRILSLIIATGLLDRAIAGPGPRLIVLPRDSALAGMRDELEELLAPSNRPRLLRLIRRHVARLDKDHDLLASTDFVRKLVCDDGGSMTIANTDRSLTVNGRRVAAPPRQIGEHVLVVTDELLGSLGVVLHRSNEPSQARPEPAGTIAP